VAAVLLRSVGVSQLAINVLLGTMETMSFLRGTGFRELSTSYGGTHEERLGGYGKGNTAADPGFTAMSLLIVKAYLHDGFCA
jgi:hypothetical protein